MRSRVIFDTNTIISSVLLPDSVPRKAFDRALDECTLLVSAPLILELGDVFNRSKFDKYITETERMTFLIGVLKLAELVDVTDSVTASRDADDDKLLELAVSGNADYLITGDGDLLGLDPFRGITILKPLDFLSLPSF